MEAAEKDKITRLSYTLIEQIDCNIVLLSELKAANAIGHWDECHLNTFANKLERSYELLNIMRTRKNGYKHLVKALRMSRQTGALETLQESSHFEPTHYEVVGLSLSQFDRMQISETTNVSGPTPFKKIPFHTREAIELSTGRRKELEILLDSLLPDGGTASIIGIGGVGKTELAKMFLHTLEEETYKNVFKQIIWINCESVLTASTDFTNIAKDYLEVPIFGSSNQQRDFSSILNDVYDKLQKSKSLIVLDNVETREIFQMCMPNSSSKKSKHSVLITSQNSVLITGTMISLGSLELNEAVEFFKKGFADSVLITDDFEYGLAELVLRLEMFPLAISQALGYMQEKMEMNPNYKPEDYLVDLDRIPEQLLDEDSFVCISSQGRTTYKTLVLALMKIETSKPYGLLASNILSKVAFMAPDNIPLSFFSNLAANDAVEGAMVLIRRFSIIKYTTVGKSSEVYFSIHRLVQDVLRIRIAQENKTESSVHSIMTTFGLNLEHDLISHAMVTWKHAAKIHSLVEEFFNFPASLVSEMGSAGLISDAFEFSNSSLIVLKHNLSTKKHASTIFWLQTLKGYYLGGQGKYKGSLENLEATLNEAKQYLHKDHWVILQLRFFITSCCFKSGQFDEAAVLCDKLYEDFKLGIIVDLRIILKIGCLQMGLRRFENALKMANYIFANLHLLSEIYKKDLEHDTRYFLAGIHSKMGNYVEAIYLCSATLQTHLKSEKRKGSNYGSWQKFHNIGTYQFYAGRFEETHDSYQKALNEMGRQNKKDCLWALHTSSNIAALMLARNIVDEALTFSIEVHEQIKKLVDAKHHLAVDSLGNVGIAYSKIGRHQDAVSILTKVAENKIFVTQSSVEARTEKYYLALSLEEIGNLERAIEVLNEIRLKCLEYPNYKPVTVDQVETAFKRLKDKVRIVDK